MRLIPVLAAALWSLAAAQGSPLLVFAASDLGPAFKQLAPAFERQAGTRITLALGSTGMLAQQIRSGAPADLFFAANESFVRDLAAESLLVDGSMTVYARGRIAAVTLASGPVRVRTLHDLSQPQIRRIAIANPQHAPYGLAARQALESAGLWAPLAPKLVYGENVQQAVQFVRSGSADAGLVARSVADTPDLAWTLVDDALHAPLTQMAAVVARSRHKGAARAFIDFVTGAAGRPVMRQFGFELPGDGR